MEKNTVCIYVAVLDCTPILSCDTFDLLVEKLDQYNGVDQGQSERLKYVPYDTKFPDDLEGTYFYKDNKGNEDKFKIYCLEHNL